MKFLTKPLLIILLIITSLDLSATSIVPFPNLGEMAKASEAVVLVHALNNFEFTEGQTTRFRTQLQVLERVKGPLNPGDQFIIQNLHLKTGDLERTIWGDLELEPGRNYFLFLDYNDNGYWQPKMLSFAAFEEMTRGGQEVLVPFGLGSEVQVLQGPDGIPREPLKVYHSLELITMLRGVVRDGTSWDMNKVATKYKIGSFSTAASERDGVNPGHCTHLSGSPIARWRDFDISSLPVYYHSGGDSGCPDAISKIQGAITDMNTQYTGIDLSDGGTHSFVPSCSGEGATDNEFTTWVNNNLNQRSLVIQFDDPCSEITDLSGCNGTLAIGGLYWFSSTHVWCGVTWRNAAYGYVVVNNGTGACQCVGASTDYDVMITHEMTHSLNVGHISTGAGTANMNPSCCNSIQTLDIECLDYMYLVAPLPVELVDFDGKLDNREVELSWQTTSEAHNDFFTLERSYDGVNFEKVGTISGKGNSNQSQFYKYIDKEPLIGISYYRLSQTDLDGKIEILEKIVSIEYQADDEIAVQPNPVRGNQIQLIYQTSVNADLDITIYSVTGQLVKQLNLEADAARNIYDINLEGLSNGVYIIKTSQQDNVQSLRFVKTN